MTLPIGAPSVASSPTPVDPDAKLRQAAKQLEGVFIEQLFAAMRSTVPEGGLIDGGSAEDIFNSMLDQYLADQLAASWDRGIGMAIYHQLRSAITNPDLTADTSMGSEGVDTSIGPTGGE
jgi:flagellar protein FlgJ